MKLNCWNGSVRVTLSADSPIGGTRHMDERFAGIGNLDLVCTGECANAAITRALESSKRKI
jgi:hypothetical protein